MGAIILSVFVIIVANVGGIYFYIQDHKKNKEK
jgi:glucose uptake protein GlcU